MKILSRQVLGGAALIASPALWHGFVTGSLPIDVAVVRWVGTAVFVWLALSALVLLVGAPAKPAAAPDGVGGDGGASGAGGAGSAGGGSAVGAERT